MKYLKLENIRAYRDSSRLSDLIWDEVSKWDWFAKRTLGVQLVNSADSIAANIAEGFGRFHKKDKQKFYFNARGSVFESAYWINKAHQRKLLSKKDFTHMINTKKISLILLGLLLLSAGFFVFRSFHKNQQMQPVSSDFSKGVLALNSNKSVYLPGEKAEFYFASLDSGGRTLCNSNLQVEITGPDGKTTSLSTADKTIANSPTCGDDNVTNDPDYIASQILEEKGQYKLKLTDLDSGKTAEASIQVTESISFDIQRSGATRINPFKSDRYPMVITVKANQDYSGQITEKIPSNFKIAWQGSAKVDGTNIIWDVDLKAGETKSLSYEYQAPQIRPELYNLGPITINNTQFDSFWHIASDDYGCQYINLPTICK
jgi:four helix bundle protein